MEQAHRTSRAETQRQPAAGRAAAPGGAGAQGAWIDGIHDSTRMAAQRQQIERLFGHGAQAPVVQRALAPADAEKICKMFTFWVTKKKKTVFTPYFLSEMEAAVMAFYTFKEADEYLTAVVEKHAQFVGTFQDAALGRQIGHGSEKDVYELQDYPAMVIGISKEPDVRTAIQRMGEEAGLLNRLHEAGIPVAEIVGVIEHKGRAAMLMYRYAEGSKSVVTNDKQRFNEPKRVGNSLHLNARSIADLLEIQQRFAAKKVKIDDIQFLIGSDGSVVVSDPLTLSVGTDPPTPNMVKMVNRLIEAAAQNEFLALIQRERRPYKGQELQSHAEALGVHSTIATVAVAGFAAQFPGRFTYDGGAGTYRYNFIDEVD